MDAVSAKSLAMRREGLIYLVLAVATLVLFLPVTGDDFINYDDQVYVTKNLPVQAGLTGAGMAWAFTTGETGNWHPLTWLSHMLDYEIYGLKPAGHHFTNLLFHITNTLLLFGFLRRVTGAMWRSATVAALFAWHPLHVESVAWVAERKDVLSTFFWLLTLLAYARYVENRKAGWFLLCLMLFAFGLLAKPMLVTLPFVLLLLDFWPFGRVSKWGPTRDNEKKNGPIQLLPARLIWEKLPFFALALISCVITFLVQKKGGAVVSLDKVPLGLRLANAPVAYFRYVGKLIWPDNLCILYPLPAEWPAWKVGGAILFILIITAGAILMARRQPPIITGWLWFLGTLVPVIGLVQVGNQAMADRYTYIPSIGFFVMLVWAATYFTRQWQQQKIVLTVVTLIICCVCMTTTAVQLLYWKNTETVFAHAAKVTQKNTLAYIYLGDARIAAGNTQEGLDYLYAATTLQPGLADVQGRIAVALSSQGKINEAITHYRKALQSDPNLLEALNNLAWILAANGNAGVRNGTEAVQLAERACELTHYQKPLFVGTLAAAYAEAGRFDDAIEAGNKAANLATSIGNSALADMNRNLTELYRTHRAYHESENNSN